MANVSRVRVVYDYWPRNPLTSEQHRLNGDIPFQSGFERWLSTSNLSYLHLEVICYETLMVLYVNGKTALSVRIGAPQDYWGFFATRGTLRAQNIMWHKF